MRNLYEKVGFSPIRVAALNFENVGVRAQKSGVGVLHHGGVSLTEFLAKFIPNDIPGQHDLAAFLLAFPTEMAPAVGRQVTVDESNKNDVDAAGSIAVMLAQAQAGKCDVIAKGTLGGAPRGYVYDPGAGAFRPDSTADAAVEEAALRASVGAGDVLTIMGTPPGTGVRSGIDRDRDTWLDGDERTERTDAADPASVPIVCADGAAGGIGQARLGIRRMLGTTPNARLTVRGRLVLSAPIHPGVDPARNGFNFKVVDSTGATIFHGAIPPGASADGRAAGWTATSSGRWWVFRDRTGSLARGITKVALRHWPAEDPGLFVFRIRGRRGTWRVGAADLPVGVSVLLGTTAQDAAGQCASVRFDGAGTPACQLTAGADSLRCR